MPIQKTRLLFIGDTQQRIVGMLAKSSLAAAAAMRRLSTCSAAGSRRLHASGCENASPRSPAPPVSSRAAHPPARAGK
ncbi:hypothetical protein EYF80_065252 [Liparis tanakae]|uniref:Uncharacterized protein n=1 Tax=Liparis tanakae TaxID=230148 RepID=A0A4Z2E8J0_9TELE|nr:hypothetical protein EYF80_065252 [Liparis tanakae]